MEPNNELTKLENEMSDEKALEILSNVYSQHFRGLIQEHTFVQIALKKFKKLVDNSKVTVNKP